MRLHQRLLKNHLVLKFAMNLWPPFWGAGIHVDEITSDFRCVRVSLKDMIFNRNYVGTHFGGSLFAMTDPYFMIMVMNNLGSKYHVWDKQAKIDFVKPGRGLLRAVMTLSDGQIEEIQKATASGEKYERNFEVEVLNQNSEVICKVQKLIYARLKPKYRPKIHPPMAQKAAPLEV